VPPEVSGGGSVEGQETGNGNLEAGHGKLARVPFKPPREGQVDGSERVLPAAGPEARGGQGESGIDDEGRDQAETTR
jgi:hypothetical protein